MAYNPFLRSRLSEGYGDYINRTPGTGIWDDYIDTDGDGIDDRYQTGPGAQDMRNLFQQAPQGFTRRSGPATQALVHFYNPNTGEIWTAPDGSYVPPEGWEVVSQGAMEGIYNQQQNAQQQQADQQSLFQQQMDDYMRQIQQMMNQQTANQQTNQQTNQYPHGRMPDFAEYVKSYPKLLQAYKKKYGDDMSKLMPWGRQHWRKHGKEAGRDMQFQAAPKYDPSLFKGKKIADLENKFRADQDTAARHQAKMWRQQHMDAAKKKYGFGTDDFNKSEYIKQRNQIASRHRRMVGAGDKTLKSGTVIPGYNP